MRRGAGIDEAGKVSANSRQGLWPKISPIYPKIAMSKRRSFFNGSPEQTVKTIITSNWRPLRRIDFSRVKVSLTGMSDPSKAVSGLAAESPAAPAVVAALADPAVTTKARRPFVQSPGDRSLDQWRGVALVFVLISHGFKQTGNVEGVGRVGVNLFFFISGILVFRSLSKGPQELAAGAKYFWIRRTKRLVPAKWFYLFCMSLLLLVIWTPPVTDAFPGIVFSRPALLVSLLPQLLRQPCLRQ